jgi:hypothetical protein
MGQEGRAHPQQEKGFQQVHRAPPHQKGQALMNRESQPRTSAHKARTKKGRR